MTAIEAKPEPITIDTARAALIVVDMQNDFGAAGGMFDRVGIDISLTLKSTRTASAAFTKPNWTPS